MNSFESLMREFDITVVPEIGFDEKSLETHLRRIGKLGDGQFFRLKHRSIDARGKKVKVNLRIESSTYEIEEKFVEYEPSQESVKGKAGIIIIGAGPAGLFAALKAIELGYKPILLERGKDVRSRRRDIADINKKHIVNPDSNYCFGEGGAGTYSDGKLYTRSKKRGSVRRIFEILVHHGATPDIFFESHPHIGTNKLPGIITAIRDEIISKGGEIHFESRMADLIIKNNKIEGVQLQNGDHIMGSATILATGHSARDVYHLLANKKILLEPKAFALGVRVEHPQALIDQIQYNCSPRGPFLPAAAYSVVNQTLYNDIQRGVFSFCMCPGGFIVPAASAPGEVVVNGMSPSRRDSRFANSGIVTAVEVADLPGSAHPLSGIEFQSAIEHKAWEFGGKSQCAPAQRLTDFVNGKISSSLPDSSYQPGMTSQNLDVVLPNFISERLKYAFRQFGRKLRGYLTEEAVVLGVESRTSAPVKIPRDPSTYEHPQIKGLYPCGEGAGYAGGIISAAMDGEKVMTAVAKNIKI